MGNGGTNTNKLPPHRHTDFYSFCTTSKVWPGNRTMFLFMSCKFTAAVSMKRLLNINELCLTTVPVVTVGGSVAVPTSESNEVRHSGWCVLFKIGGLSPLPPHLS